jgi:hypothetical protein
MKLQIHFPIVFMLSLIIGCSSGPTPRPDIDSLIQKLLDDYSQSTGSGHITHPEWYSSEMQKFILDRHAFYRHFFQTALHSAMTQLSSTFDQVVIEKKDLEAGLIYVNAAELVTGEGIYLSKDVCFPQAVY